jgi:methylated-DNA-[protein]-cysteine S-methyltransferase
VAPVAVTVIPPGQTGTVMWSVIESPIGGIGVAVEADAVCRVTFGATPGPASTAPGSSVPPVMADAVRQLREYFAGERTDFELPTVSGDATDFDRAVWEAIAGIPYGQTRSYGTLARAVGDPSAALAGSASSGAAPRPSQGAAQAVGTACNRNPLPIIVPCHRVIGADGKLVGFGGGLRRKRWLLELEARVDIERTFAPD